MPFYPRHFGSRPRLARVLKPNGKLIFFELRLSPDHDVQLWQKLLELLQHVQ